VKQVRAAIAVLAILASAACSAPAANAPVAAAAPVILQTSKGSLRFEPRGVENGACASDDCVDYKRVALASSDYALVHKIAYEGSEWLLISTASGAQQVFPAKPHFSPDGQRLIAINNDETGDGAQAGSFVYQRGQNGEFTQVAHFALAELVPVTFGGWQSPDCANIAGFTGWGKPGFDTTTETGASISHQQPGGWSLSLRPCPAPE
jgi:hypothetical protein